MTDLAQGARNIRVVPPGILALYEEFKRRDPQAYGPELRVLQKDVNMFTALTGDNNPIHRGGANRFREKAILPGLMITALIPKLSGIDFPFELDGLSLVNRHIECDFRYPIEVEASIRMRYRLLGQLKTRIGYSLDLGFEIQLVDTGKDAVRGMIQLGYA